MTPNQAEELFDIIRESRLPDDEQRKLVLVVEASIDGPARRAHPYIKIIANGDPCDTVIAAVDRNGRHVPLEVESIDLHIDCKQSSATFRGHTHAIGCGGGGSWECVLDLITNDSSLRMLADAAKPYTRDIDAPPPADHECVANSADPCEACPTEVEPELTPPPFKPVVERTVSPPYREAPRGPHQHHYVDGVCVGTSPGMGCMKRE